MFKKNRWKRRDLILLFERFELYMAAGLTLDKMLLVARQGMSPRHSASLEKVHAQVVSGSTLAKSLAVHLGLAKAVSGLIEHGESSGELVRAFGIVRHLLEKQDELLKKCMSALAYPIIIGLFAGLLTIGLVRGVMPQIIPMLKSLHAELPLLTRIVMAISDHIVSYGLYMLGSLLLLSLLFSFTYKKLKSFRVYCHRALLYIPIIGKLVYLYSLSLFLQSCGSLIESGMDVPRSYTNTVGSVSFAPLSILLADNIPRISKGAPLGSLFANRSRFVPSYVTPLLTAGEASGTLGISLIRAASIIDRDMEHSLKRLTSLIEPMMMAGMGIVVGCIALSIMMPIYDISKVLQH